MITCVHCAFELPEHLLLCPRCSGDPREAAPAIRPPGAQPSAEPAEPAASAGPGPAAVLQCGDADCEQPLRPGETACRYCGWQAPAASSRPRSGPGSLVLVLPGGRRVPLDGGHLLVGRGDSSPLGVELEPFPGVSRTHLSLTWLGEQLLATDLNSTNGSFLNGDPITSTSPARVANGDQIRLGQHCTLTIRSAT